MDRKSLMAIAAHCDDIEFLFAGTMLKYHERFKYDIVYVQSTNNMSGGWVQITKGKHAETSPAPPDEDYKKETVELTSGRLSHKVPWFIEMPQRKKEATNSAHEFFHTEPIHLDYPQRHYLDSNLAMVELRYGSPPPSCIQAEIPSILTAHEDNAAIERVANLVLEKNPEVILTHAPVDYTEEHTCTCHLVRKAFLHAKKNGYDGSLIFANAVTSGLYGEFYDRWDAFIDISGFEKKKRAAIGMHSCQVPFPEQLDLEDMTRGKICGVSAAEVYIVFELSVTCSGALTNELKKSHAFCKDNWRRMFCLEKTKHF